jgi:glyoxylase-like metal-dependent hydrolase (beta-lactamase superfamily II)
MVIDALPHAGYDPAAYALQPAPPTGLIGHGDVVDLGDRVFEVWHLPGHSPGQIGLFERATGILIAGDAIYDGPLIDFLPESCIDNHVATVRRLRDLPADVVHAGHEPSFGRARLIELADSYLRRRE